MRKQLYQTLIFLMLVTILGGLSGGCGSGKGGSHLGASDDDNTTDGITQEEIINAMNKVISLTGSALKNAFLGLPAGKELYRTAIDGEDITFDDFIIEESPDGATANVLANRGIKGEVGIDSDDEGDEPDFNKDVNISFTTHMEVKKEAEDWSIIKTSSTEIITTTEGSSEPAFNIKWVKILDQAGNLIWEVYSHDTLFDLADLPTLTSGSDVIVEVAVEEASIGIKVYLYHSGKLDPMIKLPGPPDEGYSLYFRGYTVGKAGDHLGFVEVISEESFSLPPAPFQSRAWLIGYKVEQ